jgi:hypothetical protein
MCTPDSYTLLSRKKSCSSVFSITYLPTKLTPIPKSSSTMETREVAYVRVIWLHISKLLKPKLSK